MNRKRETVSIGTSFFVTAGSHFKPNTVLFCIGIFFQWSWQLFCRGCCVLCLRKTTLQLQEDCDTFLRHLLFRQWVRCRLCILYHTQDYFFGAMRFGVQSSVFLQVAFLNMPGSPLQTERIAQEVLQPVERSSLPKKTADLLPSKSLSQPPLLEI